MTYYSLIQASVFWWVCLPAPSQTPLVLCVQQADNRVCPTLPRRELQNFTQDTKNKQKSHSFIKLLIVLFLTRDAMGSPDFIEKDTQCP